MGFDILSNKNTRVLLLVAHPDDETIFCGGTMLLYPYCQWAVVCMTDGPGNAPREEFEKAIEKFKKLGVNIISYLWLGQEKFKKTKKEMSEAEKRVIESGNNTLRLKWKTEIEQCNFNPDIVITHNERGEYGHIDHKELHLIIKSLFSNVWDFFYPKHNENKITYKKRENIELNNAILKIKRDIIHDIYKSQVDNLKGLPDLCD
ncbi:MAG: PIG-L family deacetylase, partial [Patescibacteria group bacterium]|nr:PIG-L family deacetylase [Patescibacteria group bacterium]